MELVRVTKAVVERQQTDYSGGRRFSVTPAEARRMLGRTSDQSAEQERKRRKQFVENDMCG